MTGAPIRSVVFDMDGVLLDSSHTHAQAFRQTLKEYGHPLEFDYATISGFRTTDAFRKVGIPERDVARLSKQKSDLAYQVLEREFKLIKGAEQLIPKLAAEYQLGLATSASKRTVGLLLNKTGWEKYFGSILCCDDVSESKPAPDIYLKSIENLKSRATESVVVEDAAIGVLAARRAGIRVVGYGEQGNLRAAGASQVIFDLPKLPQALLSLNEPPIRSEDWTAVIAAAGKGSRLEFDGPKILFHVGGKSILEWMLETLKPTCSQFVFVLAPTMVEKVESELQRLIPGRYQIALQWEPKGMADAVAVGVERVQTPHSLVVWGDQVTLRAESLVCTQQAHLTGLNTALTFPTMLKNDPYIHFERSSSGRLSRVLQKREGDEMPKVGEGDAGLFAFDTQILRACLHANRTSSQIMGRKTRELNFLPLIPLLDTELGRVQAPRILHENEMMGINTRGDAAEIEKILMGRLT